jgi:Tol biopolymer transport system component
VLVIAGAVAGLCSGGAVQAVAAGVATKTAAGSIVFAADQEPSLSNEIYALPLGGKPIDLSKSPFDDTQPLVSPDGRWVAFVSTRGGSTAVYIVRPDGGQPQRISPSLPGSYYPLCVWSPDSRRLAVATSSGATGVLMVVGPGLHPVTLERNPSLSSPAWSADGTLVTAYNGAAVDAYSLAGKHAWDQISAGASPGGSRQGLFAADGPVSGTIVVYDEHGDKVFSVPGNTAAWSPNGNQLAVFSGNPQAVYSGNRLQVLTMAGHRVFSKAGTRLGDGGNGLAWATNDQVVIYSQSAPNVAVDIETGKLTPVPAVPINVVARSGDGRLTATAVRSGSDFAIRVTRAGDVGRVVTQVRGCYDDGSLEPAISSVQFTPDGKSLIYQSACGDAFANFWTVSASGMGLHRLTTKDEEESDAAWSPDGGTIAFTRSQYTGLSCKGCPSDLYVISATGSDERALTSAADGEFNTNPSWSPDGTELLYEHATPDSEDIYELPAGGGSPLDLHIPGYDPAWGPTRIAYIGDLKTTSAVWAAAPDGSDRKRVATGSVTSPEWSSSGNLAWIQTPQQGGNPWIETSTDVHIALPFTNVRAFAWSPDGKQFVLAAQKARTATYDVYTMATNGTNVERLTHDVDAYSVSWRS